MDGWVKLHRKFLNWEWFDEPNTLKLFLYLLLSANHKDNKWRGILIKEGEILTGRKKLSEELKISQRSVRTSLLHLKSTNEVTIKSTNKYSIIKLENWETYQKSTSESANKTPYERPSTDQVPTTNNNVKNDKNVKNKEYSPLLNIFLKEFNTRMGTTYRPTPQREKTLLIRTQSYTIDEILRAVVGLSQSPFHKGDNERGWKADPDFLLRNDEQIDKFLQSVKGKEVHHERINPDTVKF